MKTLLITIIFVLLQFAGFAQSNDVVKTETLELKVYGNCGMCKSRIEKALTVDGVESATWDKDSKIAKVTFNSDKISVEKLHQLVAAVGHDTDKVSANNETYNKLHGCCKYERSETKADDSKNSENHKH